MRGHDLWFSDTSGIIHISNSIRMHLVNVHF